MVKFFLYYLFLLIIIKLVEAVDDEYEKCNFAFYCGYSQNYCLSKIRTNSPDVFEIILDSDYNNSLTCDVNKAFVTETEINLISKSKSKNYLRPSYINGSCDNSAQCLIGICQNNKCVVYSKCISHEQCPLNTFCSEGICIPLLEDNSTCNNSYQCKFNSFCERENKCTKLFSLEDNTDITFLKNSRNYYNNIDEVCKSGGYLSSYSTVRCQTLYNEDYECDDICEYRYNTGGKKDRHVEIKENCLCGYNRHRKKNCKLGNGEKEYIDFLNIRKEFLFNEDYIKKCHTLERDYKEICNELLNTDKSVNFRNFVKNYLPLNKLTLSIPFAYV